MWQYSPGKMEQQRIQDSQGIYFKLQPIRRISPACQFHFDGVYSRVSGHQALWVIRIWAFPFAEGNSASSEALFRKRKRRCSANHKMEWVYGTSWEYSGGPLVLLENGPEGCCNWADPGDKEKRGGILAKEKGGASEASGVSWNQTLQSSWPQLGCEDTWGSSRQGMLYYWSSPHQGSLRWGA